MNKNNTINKNDVLTDPAQIVRLELENAGYDMDTIHIPKRVFLLADSFYDTMLSRKCGEYRYPLGGELYVFYKTKKSDLSKGICVRPQLQRRRRI